MYITESMFYDKAQNQVILTLIWKTPNNTFPDKVYRYRNGKVIAYFAPEQFRYSRRGDYLVARIQGNPLYAQYWRGVGEWRIDPNIRGNVRGCM